MIDQLTPETAAKLADGSPPSSDSPDYVRALEIHIHLLRDELADERAKKSDALIAAVNEIERLTADRGTLRAALELIAVPMRIDGTYTIGRDECGYIARKALAKPAQ